MDKIYTLTHCTALAIENSSELLSNNALFGELEDDDNTKQELVQVYNERKNEEMWVYWT